MDAVYRSEWRRVLATLIRVVGDFDLAEEALHDAFTAAIAHWPHTGVPANPRAWLIATGRFKAIDALRRRARFDQSMTQLSHPKVFDPFEEEEQAVEDDRLRLIFICCHPALPAEARVALTLREVCGLTTEQIARAFLTTAPAIAKRIVRAKAKIRDARIPYEVPSRPELPERLETVLQVVYLVFTEGYAPTSGATLTRPELSAEAIYLGRMLLEILPAPDVQGILALMLLHESRRAARSSADGDLILLDHQDRSLWNREMIEEGSHLLERSLRALPAGPYTLQAAIAAEHAKARDASSVDWARIVAWYDLLLRRVPSPVVELNRAVALAMSDTPRAGLQVIDSILARGDLQDYYLLHSARADLFRRLGENEAARSCYEKALSLARLEPSRRFLQRRLNELPRPG